MRSYIERYVSRRRSREGLGDGKNHTKLKLRDANKV